MIDEYKNELYKLINEHGKEKQKILEELNNKGISLDKLNKLNNEYEQIVEKLTKELKVKNILIVVKKIKLKN